jgi:hypothetical protein
VASISIAYLPPLKMDVAANTFYHTLQIRRAALSAAPVPALFLILLLPIPFGGLF